MAIDVARIVDMLTAALLRDLGDEVDLIFCYGSLLKGEAHQYSDLDISYVPAHEGTWKSITVLVDDVMVDLYPIHWSKLESMANFDDISCTVLLQNRIVYQRSEALGDRFRALPVRLEELQQPAARPIMVRKALELFQGTGYQYYLLSQQAAGGHRLSCMQQARNILQSVLHLLSVCNQKCIDTRKLDRVLALPKLPEHFAATVDRLTKTTDPLELLTVCENLLTSTRTLLLREQQEVLRSTTTFPVVFDAAYPELRGDLQHIMLACEREDMFHFPLISLYHELMIHTAQALTGVAYSDFNSLAEYEQDLVALGFPDLLPYVAAADFQGLHRQCVLFDRRLQEFLSEHSVPLNSFADADALRHYLDGR